MLSTEDDCDDCRPDYLKSRISVDVVYSITVFVATFLVVAAVVTKKILPIILDTSGHQYASPLLIRTPRQGGRWRLDMSREQLISWTCVITLALSSVLVELILCEISGSLDPSARALALNVTLSLLLVLIVVVLPALQVFSVTRTWFHNNPRVHYTLTLVLLSLWLAAFWYMPHSSLLTATLQQGNTASLQANHSRLEASLERVGIIGISLMASLAGFAAISSIWQTFGVRHRQVSHADLTRKQAGLDATRNMLDMKRSRLRAVQARIGEATPISEKGLFTRVMGTFKPDDQQVEARSLAIEISGLETMTMSLESSTAHMQSVFAVQQRSHSMLGRLTNATSMAFACYCFYRIGATSMSSLRRWWQPSSTFSTSDPINNILALLTTHFGATLDHTAWARQISFFLSGIMLLLSFSAVLQTFRLFSRFLAPGLSRQAASLLPLTVAQVAGMYVISSALLLRSSNLTSQHGSRVTDALGLPLDVKFIEAWFESWFLVAVGLTATGILVSRKVARNDDDLDELDDDLEANKRSS